ncbi:MAG: undecaprenyl-diphosphate phosphatase [Rikenellaceae bacterium]
MNIIEAIILGIVQGITEFLPVSSSGHLQIVKALMGVELEENIAFDLALHAGTVCSTILVLWHQISKIVRGVFTTRNFINEDQAYVLKIALSMIPVAIVGFTLEDKLNVMLSSNGILIVVGCMLLLTALLLAFATYAKPRERESISYRDSFIIGIAQAVAVMPGISRSGATIATGLILGNKKESVAQFSFLMVLVPILGKSLLSLIGGDAVWDSVGVVPMAAGFLSSFVVGVLACKFMIDIIKRGRLVWFAYYCLIAAIFSFALYFFN